ncbi:class I SAM-dependent methyltransferase [Thalassobacillus hwangdonensis]|uniref:Class I SAM-dependent methyltransferase n=1 Tax=Thalassobacillus hwangdonensis TaxID=546108 RepID=A0ABW3L0R9_9BACI
MLNNQGFDLWADHYDETVRRSEGNNQYPFAGYKEILNSIYNEVMQKPNGDVLDIGFGTGVLTTKLYEHGHRIDGIDFSSKMISIAKAKMPHANLIEWDISNGLPSDLTGKHYDSIISTYTLHHLNDEAKVAFISELLSYLKKDGKLYFGDISFETREKHDQCREENRAHWDEDEYYFVCDELTANLSNHCKIEFRALSHCGGVFIISN